MKVMDMFWGGSGNQAKRGAPGRGSKWFVHLPIPKNLTKSKFAKIPNFHVQWGGGGVGGLVKTIFQLMRLSPSLLKSKNIFTREFAENFLSFRAKKCLGMVLDFEYQVVRVYEVYANYNY